MSDHRQPFVLRPMTVVLRYSTSPAGFGFAPGIPSIDGDPALPPSPDEPYVEMACATSAEGKATCQILYVDEELRGKLRLIRFDFVRVLESLGAITRERAQEIFAEPLVEPHDVRALPLVDAGGGAELAPPLPATDSTASAGTLAGEVFRSAKPRSR